jgi:hypothetical protein
MPRDHGLLLVTIWDDQDWLALGGAAQRAYALLLSQPKLTLIGLLDYLPQRWARLAVDTTLDSIEAAIDELEASRFVVVDRHTDELLIRTFVKHDIRTVLKNKNLLAGMWNAWRAIQSRQLRLIAVQHIPASVWDSPRCQPHPEAQRMRTSHQLELPVPTTSPDQQSEPPSSLLPPPTYADADNKQPGNSRGTAQPAAAVDNPVRTADDRQERLAVAVELLVDRELDRNPSRHNARRHRDATRRGKLADHHQAGHGHLLANPALTPTQLADLLEPPGPPNGAQPPEPERTTTDGTPFMPGIGAMPGPTDPRQPPDPQRNLAGIADARNALHPTPEDGT